MNKFNNKRTTVTVDDRRAALVAAKSRKPADINKVPQNVFLKQFFKERMGYTINESAPLAAVAVANEMGMQLDLQRIAVVAKEMKAAQAVA